jgi:hypothetical protein
MCQIGHTVQWLNGIPKDDPLAITGARDIIATGLFVTYARSFTTDKKGRKLERDDWVDLAFRDDHDRFVKLRNGRYAHTDRSIPWRTVALGRDEAIAAGLNDFMLGPPDPNRFLEITTEPDIGLAELEALANNVSANVYRRLDAIETLLGANPLPTGEQGLRRLHVLAEGGFRATEVDFKALLNPPASET